MANLTPTPEENADVWQWDGGTALLGGAPTTPLNRQAQALLNRQAWLRNEVARVEGVADDAADDAAAAMTAASSALSYVTDNVAQLPDTSYFENNYACMLAKMADGRIVGWGRATASNLGTGHTHDGDIRPSFSNFAPKIPAGVTIAGFAMAGADSFVWLSNGWVYHAGANARGIGGHGDTTRRYIFTRINYFFSGGLSVIDVKPRCYRSDDQYSNALFLCSNGEVYFSGYSNTADAGDGINAERNISSPVKCLGITGVVGISIGSDNNSGNFAWRADGTCYAWGHNLQGLLGLGTSAATYSPVVIPTLLVSKVVSRVSINTSNARYGFTLFLLKDGTVKAAGYNLNNNLGDGTTTDRNTPTTVIGLSDITDVGIGGGDFGWGWAATTGKRLKVWGCNVHGVLGVGDTAARGTPLEPIGWTDEADVDTLSGSPPFQGKVVKVITGKSVASGYSGQQMVVLDEDGNVWSSGMNLTQSVGNNSTGINSRFKRAALMGVAPGDKIVDIHIQGSPLFGGQRLFALTQQGRLVASGPNSYSILTCVPGSGYYGNIFVQPVRLGV